MPSPQLGTNLDTEVWAFTDGRPRTLSQIRDGMEMKQFVIDTLIELLQDPIALDDDSRTRLKLALG